MKLKKLFLRNFATYSRVELDYDKLRYPLFVSGETGAGKTSILVDGLSAGLFGKAYGERREASFKYAAGRRGVTVVKLEFELGGSTYLVTREIGGTIGHRATLYKVSDGGSPVVIAPTVREVESQIKRLIGLDMDDFLHTVVVRQGEVASLISREIDPKKRTELFQKIFKLEFRRFQQKAKELKREMKDEVTSLKTRIDSLEEKVDRGEEIAREIGVLKKDLEKTIDERRRLEGERNRKKAEMESMETEIAYLEALSRIQEIRRKIIEKRREADSLKRKLRSTALNLGRGLIAAEKLITKIDEIAAEKSALRELIRVSEEEMNELRRRLEERNREIRDVRLYMDEFEEEVVRPLLKVVRSKALDVVGLERDWENFKSRIEALNRRIDGLREKRARLNLERESHLDAIKKLKGGTARCPVCFSLLRDVETHLKKHSSSLMEIERRISEVNGEVEKVEGEVEEVVHELSEKIREKLEVKLNEYLGDARKMEEAIKRVDVKLNELRSKLVEKEKQELKLTNLQKLALRVREKIEGLDVSVEGMREYEWGELEEELTGGMEDLTRLKAKMESLGRELEDLYVEEEREKLKLQATGVKLEVDPDKAADLIRERRRRIKEIRGEIEELSEIIEKLRGKIGEVSGRIGEKEKQLEEIEKLRRELEEKREKLSKVEADYRALDILDMVFDPWGLPLHLLERYLREISIYANMYLERFMSEYRIDIGVDERTKNVVIDVFDELRNTKREIFTYSGGERTLIGFAIRLAISKVLAEEMAERPRFLIIDEGFGYISENLRDAVVKLISELGDDYEQIIVTSHIGDIRESGVFQQELRVVKEEGVSKIIQPG